MRRRLSLFIGFLLALALYFPSPVLAGMEGIKGRILLDVERNGAAWYVSPVSGYRYALGSPAQAFQVMRMFGVGISEIHLSRVATEKAPFDTDIALLSHVQGRILLDVERNGAAWYVDPRNGRRYSLGSPWQAFHVMSMLGLGITAAGLDSIPEGTLRGSYIHHNVPFSAQAPFSEWWDQRQNEGCEEAVAIMAVRWAHGTPLSLADARTAIIGASEYEESVYGSYQDTSVADTASRIFKEYFAYYDIEVRSDIDAQDIVDELGKGNVVAVGVDARLLHNPYFSWPPPTQHMILVVGFDPISDEFIANDPGTRYGANIRYEYSVLADALLDYPSGYHEPLIHRPASMIVVRPAISSSISVTMQQ